MKSNTSSTVMVLLVLGWGFNYFGQLVSRQAHKVRQNAAAD